MKCNKCQDKLPLSGESVMCRFCYCKYHCDCIVRETKWRNMIVEQKSKWACINCKGNSSSSSRPNSNVSSLNDEAALEDVSIKALLTLMNSHSGCGQDFRC